MAKSNVFFQVSWTAAESDCPAVYTVGLHGMGEDGDVDFLIVDDTNDRHADDTAIHVAMQTLRESHRLTEDCPVEWLL